MPSNMFAMGTQTLAPGGRLGSRAFAVGEGVFFVYQGRGRAMVNGQLRSVAPESLIYVARGATHDIQNDGGGELSFAWIVTPPGLDTLVRRIGVERVPGGPAPAPFDLPGDARDSYRRCHIIGP
jgi:mannose-6-phosphate isomerase-like protein (cupin superfamily)